MARTVRDAKLESRTSREKLPAASGRSNEPHWRGIEPGLHLGYYRGKLGGTWVARLYLSGRYRKTSLGKADDSSDADGVAVLSYKQAQDGARLWATREARNAADLAAGVVPALPYSVREAIEAYLKWFKANKRGYRTAKSIADRHILPALGSVDVSKLTKARVKSWLEGFAESAPLVRAKIGKPTQARSVPQTADNARKRRATANRGLTVLKAALNRAAEEDGKAPINGPWTEVKAYKGVDQPTVRYLTQDEARRLINASSGAFRNLLRAALFTGCRYSELTRLEAHDFDQAARTIHIRQSKSGKPRHVHLNDEGQAFFRSIATGKAGNDRLLPRDDGKPWGASDHARPMATACKAAKIKPAIGFHILRHTFGSWLAMGAAPMAVIAEQLGHAGTRLTERHYAHLGPSYVAATFRASMPTLGIDNETNVVALPTPSSLKSEARKAKAKTS